MRILYILSPLYYNKCIFRWQCRKAVPNRRSLIQLQKHQSKCICPTQTPEIQHGLNFRPCRTRPIPFFLFPHVGIPIRKQVQQTIAALLKIAALSLEFLDVLFLPLAELALRSPILLSSSLLACVRYRFKLMISCQILPRAFRLSLPWFSSSF